LNRIIPEFDRTFRFCGLKYLPDLPIDTYFIEWKKFFTKLLRKFRGRRVSAGLLEERADRSTVRTGLRDMAYFCPSIVVYNLTEFSLGLALFGLHPKILLPTTI